MDICREQLLEVTGAVVVSVKCSFTNTVARKSPPGLAPL